MSIKVEVFSSPGCGKCGQAKATLKKVAEEIGAQAVQWRQVNILEELDYAVQLGVLSTPAIAVDGKLVFTSLPSPKQLHATLAQKLVGAKS